MVTKQPIPLATPISVLNGFNSLSFSFPLKCCHPTATRPKWWYCKRNYDTKYPTNASDCHFCWLYLFSSLFF